MRPVTNHQGTYLLPPIRKEDRRCLKIGCHCAASVAVYETVRPMSLSPRGTTFTCTRTGPLLGRTVEGSGGGVRLYSVTRTVKPFRRSFFVPNHSKISSPKDLDIFSVTGRK